MLYLCRPFQLGCKPLFLSGRNILFRTKMQPSITSFFKSKQTDAKEQNESTSNANNENDSSTNSQSSAKRTVSDLEEGSEKLTSKRLAVETLLKSPTKDGGDRQKAKPIAVQSPLLNVETLIRKKIQSGASALHENIGVSWFKALQHEFDKPYFKKLSIFVAEQRRTKTVFPPPERVFTWTHHHGIRDTQVVVIGQDPYHGYNQAHGLSFSVQKGIAIPKSLQNIYKELSDDIPNFTKPSHGELTGWAKQGVLMLNACLTVNKGEPNSHQGKGWEQLTDAVILWISKNVNHKVVFLLWGKFAQKKSNLIDKRHKILVSAHPSPFSADSGFFGCKHFSQTNAFLRSQGLKEIDWAAL